MSPSYRPFSTYTLLATLTFLSISAYFERVNMHWYAGKDTEIMLCRRSARIEAEIEIVGT